MIWCIFLGGIYSGVFTATEASEHAGLLESLPDTKPWYEKIVAQTK